MHPATSPARPSVPPSLAFRCTLALLRALRSTTIIITVALLAVALREGDFRWSHISGVAVTYRALFALVFLALLVWELRPARPPASSP